MPAKSPLFALVACETGSNANNANGDTIPLRERAGEYLMLRLRTVDGVEEGEYTKSFLLPFEPLEEVFQKLAKQDLCKNVSGRWRLTPKGFMLSNSIIVLLLEQQQKSKPLTQKK